MEANSTTLFLSLSTECITDVINKTVKESEEKNDTAAPCVEAMKQSLFQG